jgi:hypothetical protein
MVRFAQARLLTLFFLLAYSWAWIFSLIVPRLIRQTALGPNSDSIDIPLSSLLVLLLPPSAP